MSNVAGFNTLCSLSGYSRIADVKMWLHRTRIRFFAGKGGKPSTTLEELNRALYPQQDKDNEPVWDTQAARSRRRKIESEDN